MGLDLARELAAGDGHWTPLGSVRLLAPLQPRQMRDAMSFETHIRQSGRGGRAVAARAQGGEAAFRAAMAEPTEPLAEVYRQMPIYYITNRMIVVGPETTVRWPRYSKVMDYELEIAIVTRRTRANIRVAEANDHIFGYTIFNDFSARDKQMAEMAGRLGPAKGKSFDGANVLGPWIVTPDELGDPQTLNVEVRVNGETRAKGTTANMLFPFPQILAYASQDETIHAGEVFGSGTVGNCCGLVSGLDLARTLRDRRPELPVILTTGYSSHASEVVAEGFTLVEKPYHRDVLADALRSALEKRGPSVSETLTGF
jgi:2-keto-4-pentenoate hydratase/2-oxohepta-3-ene-1,7-dioic acid hydratase in catechol pathway